MPSVTTTKKAFWFHYNKPESRRVGKPQITLHVSGMCIILDNVDCRVPVKGRIRKTQPHWVMAGKTKDIQIQNNIATIN
jgi:hypothetical protein